MEPNCVVIPMDMDSKEKILVGNINLKLGYLDNVHEADISIGKLVNLNVFRFVLIEFMIFTKLYIPSILGIYNFVKIINSIKTNRKTFKLTSLPMLISAS